MPVIISVVTSPKGLGIMFKHSEKMSFTKPSKCKQSIRPGLFFNLVFGAKITGLIERVSKILIFHPTILKRRRSALLASPGQTRERSSV